MSNGYTYLEGSFLDDPDYQRPAEKLLMIHLFNLMDPAGVSPWKLLQAVERTGFSDRTLRKTLDDLEARFKLIKSDCGNWIWVKSGVWYRLQKGRFSKYQLRGTVEKLHFWGARGCFETVGQDLWRKEIGTSKTGPPQTSETTLTNFPLRVAQLYAVKYALLIPIVSVPYLTLLQEELNERTDIHIVDNLSTPAKRVFIKLTLSKYQPQLDTQDPGWIQELFDDYAPDRVFDVVHSIVHSDHDEQIRGEPLADFVRRMVERRYR